MSKIQTNEDLIIDLMNFSPYGALGQLFIIEAVRAYTEHQIENKDESIKQYVKKCEEAEENGSIYCGVDMRSWTGVAEDVKKRMDEFYNRNNG